MRRQRVHVAIRADPAQRAQPVLHTAARLAAVPCRDTRQRRQGPQRSRATSWRCVYVHPTNLLQDYSWRVLHQDAAAQLQRASSTSQAALHPQRRQTSPAIQPFGCKWNNTHFAFFNNAAPPMPPTVDCERNEESLQKRIRKEARAIEHDKVEKVRCKHYRPADKHSTRGEPYAQNCGDGACNLKPMRSQGSSTSSSRTSFSHVCIASGGPSLDCT